MLVLAPQAGADHNQSQLVSTGPAGGNGGSASSFRGASSDGQVAFFETGERLVSSDADSTLAESGSFRATGRPPTVRLMSPAANATVRGDTRLVLAGNALDDDDRELRGRRLRWLSRGRVLARGRSASVLANRVGRTITLEARDRSGRRTRESVGVRIERVAPVFVGLRVPRRTSRRARSLTLRVGSTLPTRMTVKGRGIAKPGRAAVGQRPRRIRVRVVPGRRALRLVLRLGSGKRATKHVVRIRR